MTHGKSVVVPVEPKRVLVLKSAVERLILAADMYGVARLDSDDMDDDAVELQDATEGMKDALAAAPAPAPSSLAGGEVMRLVPDRVLTEALYWMARGYERVHSMPRVSDTELANKIEAAKADLSRARDASPILAALSPEAPAREGVVKACADFQEAIDYFEADVADALAEDSERADLWDREVTVNIDALKAVMLAALTPRHEAPAEGAGEAMTEREVRQWIDACNHEPARQVLRDYLALRARSSAPEAREEALGNLLAVIHGDGGHRAVEVGVAQAAVEAEKIVASLLSSAPEAREGLKPQVRPMEDTLSAFGVMKDHFVGASSRPVTHPAAPSADKLRDHLEWIETVLTDPVPGYTARIATAREYIDQALAALKAEGA